MFYIHWWFDYIFRTAEEHASRRDNKLHLFEEANLQKHPGKSLFAKSQVQYLGYIMSENGISPSPEKVKAVRQYPTPKCVRNVRTFLGLTSFYGRLVTNFAEIAKPLAVNKKGSRRHMGTPPTGSFWEFERKASNHPSTWLCKFQVTFYFDNWRKQDGNWCHFVPGTRWSGTHCGLWQSSAKYGVTGLFGQWGRITSVSLG